MALMAALPQLFSATVKLPSCRGTGAVPPLSCMEGAGVTVRVRFALVSRPWPFGSTR